MENKKAQITPIAIIVTFISIVIVAVLLPTINTMITTTCASVDSFTCLVMQMIPWMMGIAIILSMFVYASVNYSRQQ